MLATSYALILLVGALGSGVFQGLAAMTAGTGPANPVIVSIFDGFAAALAALSSLVLALVQVGPLYLPVRSPVAGTLKSLMAPAGSRLEYGSEIALLLPTDAASAKL